MKTLPSYITMHLVSFKGLYIFGSVLSGVSFITLIVLENLRPVMSFQAFVVKIILQANEAYFCSMYGYEVKYFVLLRTWELN